MRQTKPAHVGWMFELHVARLEAEIAWCERVARGSRPARRCSRRDACDDLGVGRRRTEPVELIDDARIINVD